jgi:TRAP-type C4-dicarboxylate transport system substrate-binding protein
LQQGTVDGQENPLPSIMAKKYYEVQSHITLTGHIIESLLTITGSHVWSKLSDADKKVFEEVLVQAAAKSSDQIRESSCPGSRGYRSSGPRWRFCRGWFRC